MRRHQPRTRPVVVAALLSALACAPEAPPNLLLVTIDTLRPDHMSAYGYLRDTTPALREFAERATRFDTAYAPQGITAPSHATLFTGVHPLAHGLTHNGLRFEPSQPMLAERLQSAGYATAAFVGSYPVTARFGFARGFDVYDDTFTAEDATVEVERWQGDAVDGAFDRNAAATVDRALRWLEARASDSGPFFLWTHFFEPHTPLRPDPSVRNAFDATPLPEGYAATFAPWANAYDAEILYTDRQLGRLLDGLRDADLEDSTLIVVTADHGEGLNEHGWWMHGVSVHESEIRIPLIIRLPGQTEPRTVVAPVQLADLVPTLASWLPLGLERAPIEPASASGLSLAGALRGDADALPPRDLHFFRRYRTPYVVRPMFPIRTDGSASTPKRIVGDQLGVRRGRWKLLYAEEQREAALYDLDADPRERHNIADDHKELTRELVASAIRFAEAHGREAARRSGTIDPRDREALEALGYVE